MKKIYTIVALLTLCFCVATGLTGCKKTPGEELNNKPLNEVIKLIGIPGYVAEDETEKLEDISNKIQSSEGYTGDWMVLEFKALEDITIKSVSATASFNFELDINLEIAKGASTIFLEGNKVHFQKNTFSDCSMTSEEGVTFKKGYEFLIRFSGSNTVGRPIGSDIPVDDTLKNFKVVFM